MYLQATLTVPYATLHLQNSSQNVHCHGLLRSHPDCNLGAQNSIWQTTLHMLQDQFDARTRTTCKHSMDHSDKNPSASQNNYSLVMKEIIANYNCININTSSEKTNQTAFSLG
jgi:hypothetical protein